MQNIANECLPIDASGAAPLIVLKLGSSLLGDEADVATAVHQVYGHHRSGRRVVVVVSAWRGAAALLVTALDRAGVPAVLFDPPQAGLRTLDSALVAAPCDLDDGLVGRALDRGVVVIPRCFGTAEDGGLALLAARARCGRDADRGVTRRPLRVALLGLGTVGGGVYRHLSSAPRRFSIVGIAVRDGERHRRSGVPEALLCTDAWELLERPSDVVIELLPGCAAAARLVAAALARGRHVVTANKAVMAEEGEWLARQATARGVHLRWSAAVGGGVPMVEAVTRAAARGSVVALRGVLNGTCNFVLDRMAAGVSRQQAVRLAQEKGFAEADPGRDLDGSDAACKLRLLARAAFGAELAAADVARRGLAAVDAEMLAAARAAGRVVRLVATCERGPRGVVAEVAPLLLPVDDYLAGARGEENRLLIECAGMAPQRLAGRGAGRWPTSEAVMADLFDLERLLAADGELAGAARVATTAVQP